MTRLFKLLFPHASTSADLAQVEKELQAQINALRSRLDVAAAQAGVTHESNEIILGSLRGRVTALEARANAQAALIDALETEVSRPLDPDIKANLDRVRDALSNIPKGGVFPLCDLPNTATSLIVSDGDGEAKPTEVIRLKPTKGPKGGSRK